MSIITDSMECSKSPLELFRVMDTQTAIEDSSTVEYLPISTIRNNAPIEFHVPALSDEYLDLQNSKLYVKFEHDFYTLFRC